MQTWCILSFMQFSSQVDMWFCDAGSWSCRTVGRCWWAAFASGCQWNLGPSFWSLPPIVSLLCYSPSSTSTGTSTTSTTTSSSCCSSFLRLYGCTATLLISKREREREKELKEGRCPRCTVIRKIMLSLTLYFSVLNVTTGRFFCAK